MRGIHNHHFATLNRRFVNFLLMNVTKSVHLITCNFEYFPRRYISKQLLLTNLWNFEHLPNLYTIRRISRNSQLAQFSSGVVMISLH